MVTRFLMEYEDSALERLHRVEYAISRMVQVFTWKMKDMKKRLDLGTNVPTLACC